MLAIGTSVVAGKYIGENDINSASEIFTKAILTTVIFGFFSYCLYLTILRMYFVF